MIMVKASISAWRGKTRLPVRQGWASVKKMNLSQYGCVHFLK
jgi:hypothetical protein